MKKILFLCAMLSLLAAVLATNPPGNIQNTKKETLTDLETPNSESVVHNTSPVKARETKTKAGALSDPNIIFIMMMLNEEAENKAIKESNRNQIIDN